MELTDKQKKIMKTFCLYLGSFVTKNACMGFEFSYDEPQIMDWNGWESPDVTISIDGFDSVTDLAEEITTPIIGDYYDVYEQNGVVYFCVDCINKIIHFKSEISELSSKGYEDEYDINDIKSLTSWEEFESKIRGDDEVILQYSGSGDEGAIDPNIETSDGYVDVPFDLLDWCYNKLSEFGSWEDGDGSQGKFIFDFINGKITLHHESNYYEAKSYILPKTINFS